MLELNFHYRKEDSLVLCGLWVPCALSCCKICNIVSISFGICNHFDARGVTPHQRRVGILAMLLDG